MHWADTRVWDTILSTPAAQEHEKLKKTIYHYHITQYAFYHIWMELPMEFKKLEEFKSMTEMANWAANYHNLAGSFVLNLNEDDLDKVIHIPWSSRLEKVLGRKPAETNLVETMFQVITHSSYHRGQVNSHLRSAGAEPPMVDFIAWVWLGKPPAGSFFPPEADFQLDKKGTKKSRF
jgi:uncharacterized damage-inducible protein DinB